MHADWLSERSLPTDKPWILANGISNNPRNPRRILDIAPTRYVLGYEPQDAAPARIGDENDAQPG